MPTNMEPFFVVTVHHYVTPNKTCQFSHARFLLHTRTFFLEDDDSIFREDRLQQGLLPLVFPEFLFGSTRHRNLVASHLLEAGWTNQGYLYDAGRTNRGGLDMILDDAFSRAKSILENERKNRDNNDFGNVVSIIFRVRKIVRMNNLEAELEARAVELSMREDPKRRPATEESILGLPEYKSKKGDGDCIICMEELVSLKAVSMPCSHPFHRDCIEKWLNSSHICPLCRFPMPTDAGKP